MTDSYIDAGAVVERCILDKYVFLGKNARVGEKRDVGDLGLTLIGKNTRVPEGFHIGRNCVLGTDFSEEDLLRHYPGSQVPPGTELAED